MNWLFLVSQMVPYPREQDNLLSGENYRDWYKKNYMNDPEAVEDAWARAEEIKAKQAAKHG